MSHGHAALDALAGVAPLLIDSAYSGELVAVLERLPASEIEGRPGLALARGRHCLLAGDREEAQRWYATARATAGPDDALQARVFWELGCYALAEDQVAGARVVLDLAATALRSRAERAPDFLHLRALITERERGALASRDDYRRAIAMGDHALTLVTRVIALRNLASAVAHDEPHSAAGLCGLALALIDGDRLDERIRPSVENVLAYALICDGKLDEARGHSTAAAADARRLGHPLVEAYAGFNLSITSELSGQLDDARRRLSELQSAAVAARFEELLGWIRVRSAWIALKEGRAIDAERMLADHFAQAGRTPYRSAVETLRAILDFHAGRFIAAIDRFHALVDGYSQEGDWLSAFVALLWLVYLHTQLGDRTNAHAALGAAMQIGEPRGFRWSPNWWSDELIDAARDTAGPDQRAYVETLRRCGTALTRLNARQIGLLRDGNITVDGVAIDDAQWRTGRTGSRVLRRLMASLAAAHPVGLWREELADLLWPESDGDRALKNLDSGLNDLRHLLRGIAGVSVVTEGSHYRLLLNDEASVSARPS